MVLGLTGSIGSGKSTVAQVFGVLGVPVYNSDERARELYFVPEVRKQVEELLGKEAYVSEKELDRKFIRSKIFSDATLLQKINDIIHPAVKKDFAAFKKEHKKAPYVVKESALLFEAGIAATADKILLVTTTDELRKKRLISRDKISEADIAQILSRQMPDSEKIKKADWVLENNEEKLLLPQILKIHQALLH